MKTTVEIIDWETGQATEAELSDEVTEEHLVEVETAWRPILIDAAQRLSGVDRPSHYHWDWTSKGPELQLLASSFYSISSGGAIQGLMKVETVGRTCRIQEQLNKPLVYVDYLEAAPWNIRPLMKALGQRTRYGAVGTRLIEVAVALSQDEGFQGRVGLHSLQKSESFYVQSCGMTGVGRDLKKQNLLWCEFTPEQAAQFQRGGRSK